MSAKEYFPTQDSIWLNKKIGYKKKIHYINFLGLL